MLLQRPRIVSPFFFIRTFNNLPDVGLEWKWNCRCVGALIYIETEWERVRGGKEERGRGEKEQFRSFLRVVRLPGVSPKSKSISTARYDARTLWHIINTSVGLGKTQLNRLARKRERERLLEKWKPWFREWLADATRGGRLKIISAIASECPARFSLPRNDPPCLRKRAFLKPVEIRPSRSVM